MLIERNFRPAHRKPVDVKRIIIHWTANENESADADNNVRYFAKTKRKASSHYVVDADNVIQCVDDSDIAFHAGQRWANKVSIGIETCANFTCEKDSIDTFENLKALCLNLHKKYPNAIFIRHYDVTGKICPKWFAKNEYQTQKQADEKWISWLKELDPEIAGQSSELLGISSDSDGFAFRFF